MRKLYAILGFTILSCWGARAQTISTIAGIDWYPFEEGCDATAAKLNAPCGLAVDDAGNVYYSEPELHVVRKIDVYGKTTTVAGIAGVAGYSGNGTSATSAELNSPYGITLDDGGNLFIADTKNNAIRKVSTSGIITTYQSGINQPFDLAFNKAGQLYVSTGAGNSIIRVAAGGGGIATIASGFNNTIPGGPYGSTSDLWELGNSRLSGVALDATGNLYIADFWENMIRKIPGASGALTTISGHGGIGWGDYGGDGGLAKNARLNGPKRICVDKDGNIVFSDSRNSRIRSIDANGTITTIAGGKYGNSGDGGPATAAALAFPAGIAFDKNGNMYIADMSNRSIRKVSPKGSGINNTTAATANISIAPNPGNGAFTLKGKWDNAEQNIAVDVINVTGNVVFTSALPINNGSIDAHIILDASLANGTYLLRISGTNQIGTYPFVIAR